VSRRAVLPLALLALVAAGCGGAAASGTASGGTTASGRAATAPAARGLVAIGAGLRGPAGLRASVYARGLVHQSAFALDPQGRLWISTSGATDHASDAVYVVARQGARPRRMLSRLDGPLGLTWRGGLLYVASMGRVDAFGLIREGHFTRHRTILVEPAGHGWNDGIVQTRDGRLLMGISASCDHCRPRSPFNGAIVSFRGDGSDVHLYARSVRAPYGLAFSGGGSHLLVTMNQRDDLGARTPGDWLSLVRQGDDWGFPACYGQGGPACRGVPKPLAVLDRHAAAGGVAVVDGSLGPAVGRAAIVAEWQLGKVLRVPLAASGARASGPAALVLHGVRNPLPVLAERDGSLLVGDWTTGVVYRIARV
jgi:glucose/arabinose dehydrogenase